MKKLLIILFTIIAASAYGQQRFTLGSPTINTVIDSIYGTFVPKEMLLPRSSSLDFHWDSTGAVRYSSADSSVYVFTGYQWIKVNATGSGTGSVASITAGGYSLGGTITVSGTITPDTSSGKLATKTDLGLYYTKTASDARYQLALGYTAENQANKATTFGTLDNTKYPSTQAVATYIASFGYLSSAITSLNGLTAVVQTFTVGTAGAAPNITSTTATHTFNFPLAATSGVTAGMLSKADYDIFNAKQPAGNYITALTGDGTAAGPGIAVFTLTTVNSNVGTFGSATKSLTATVNAKGLITALAEQTVTPAIGSVTGLGTGVATLLGGASSGTGGPAGTTSPTLSNPIVGTQPPLDNSTKAASTAYADALRTATATLTNKRWTARVGNTTSSATPTINTDNVDIYKLTAQAADITSMTTNLSGTPVDGDILEIQITGTAARAITWGASFVSTTVTLPATTVTTATLTVVLQYYTTSSYGNNKWGCVNYY